MDLQKGFFFLVEALPRDLRVSFLISFKSFAPILTLIVNSRKENHLQDSGLAIGSVIFTKLRFEFSQDILFI